MAVSSRRRARLLAFQTIYQRAKIGIQPESEAQILDRESLNPPHLIFHRLLVEKTWQNLKVIDTEIRHYLKNWRQERISDSLNALFRISICELIFFPETDGKVVLNEAIEICRDYVDDNATRILNGVLHAVWKAHQPD